MLCRVLFQLGAVYHARMEGVVGNPPSGGDSTNTWWTVDNPHCDMITLQGTDDGWPAIVQYNYLDMSLADVPVGHRPTKTNNQLHPDAGKRVVYRVGAVRRVPEKHRPLQRVALQQCIRAYLRLEATDRGELAPARIIRQFLYVRQRFRPVLLGHEQLQLRQHGYPQADRGYRLAFLTRESPNNAAAPVNSIGAAAGRGTGDGSSVIVAVFV